MFVHDPLSSSGYLIIISTHPIANNNLPSKTLVIRQSRTNLYTWLHVFLQETLDSLSDLYMSLREEDLWAGLWMERCRFPETAVAIAYETQGLFELAQESYEKVLRLLMLSL